MELGIVVFYQISYVPAQSSYTIHSEVFHKPICPDTKICTHLILKADKHFKVFLCSLPVVEVIQVVGLYTTDTKRKAVTIYFILYRRNFNYKGHPLIVKGLLML